MHALTTAEHVTNRIVTAPNIISFLRLCLVPVFLWLLLAQNNLAAVVVFAVAALTDFVDGQLARRMNMVSKLGKVLDPAVDTILMMTGVIGAFLVDRCPLWIVIVIVAREVFMLVGGGILLKAAHIRIPVIFAGKVATTLLFVGFAALLLGIPVISGLDITSATWLPGFNETAFCWGIWVVYAGVVLQLGVTVYYCVQALRKLTTAKVSHGV